VPKIDVADATSDLLGFAATATVPFSPEASTTGYVTGGMGGYQMSISGKDASLSTPWKLGIHAGLGVCFAPEHWRSVYLDIQVRYTRVYFAGEYWQHLAITGGVGFHFQ
jgi:opacity protein-like surface antigen